MSDEKNSSSVQDSSLTQVRELLFGAHARDVNQQIDSLRQDMRSEVDRLQQELQNQIKQVQSKLEDEVRIAHERMDSNKSDHGVALQALTDSLAHRAGDLETRLGQSEQELRQHTVNQTKNLWDDVRVRYDDLSRHVEDELDKLKAASARRASLSEMFRELADRLDQNPDN